MRHVGQTNSELAERGPDLFIVQNHTSNCSTSSLLTGGGVVPDTVPSSKRNGTSYIKLNTHLILYKTERPKQPSWDLQVSSPGVKTTISCCSWWTLEILYPIRHLVSGIKLVPVSGIWYHHVVPRGYHQYVIIDLALRPSCSTINARTMRIVARKTLPAAT